MADMRYTSEFSLTMKRWVVKENGEYLDSDEIVERFKAFQAQIKNLERLLEKTRRDSADYVYSPQ